MAVKIGRVGKKRTNRSLKKRVRMTNGDSKKKGQYAIDKVAHKHLLLQKSKRQKAKASKPILLVKGDAQRVAKMI